MESGCWDGLFWGGLGGLLIQMIPISDMFNVFLVAFRGGFVSK